MTALGLVIQQAGNGSPCYLLTRGSLTNDRAVLVSEEFYRQISEIRARDFAVKPPVSALSTLGSSFRSGSFITLGRYRTTYYLSGDAYIVVITHAQENPFAAHPFLEQAKRVAASVTTGITKLKGAAYTEIYFALTRVLATGIGTELTGQRILEINPHFVSASDKPADPHVWSRTLAMLQEADRNTGELSRADVVIPGDFFTAPSSPLQGVGSEQTDLQLVGEYAIMASERTSEDSPGALDSGRDSRPRLLSPAISDGSQGRSSSGHTRSTSSEFVVEPLRRGLASADSSRASLNLGVPGSRKSRANLGPIFLSSLSTPTSVFASSPPPSPGPNMPTSHSTDNLQS